MLYVCIADRVAGATITTAEARPQAAQALMLKAIRDRLRQYGSLSEMDRAAGPEGLLAYFGVRLLRLEPGTVLVD